MNEYTLDITGKEIHIDSPDICAFSDIDIVTTNYGDYVVDLCKYPNGAIVEYHKYVDKIIIRTNCDLVKVSDSNYSLKLR